MRTGAGRFPGGWGVTEAGALLLALALVAAACGSGDDTSPPTEGPPEQPAPADRTEATEPGGASEQSEPNAAITRQPTSIPLPDLSGRSFLDNLTTRVDDGEWTLEEGLIATLQLFTGEAEPGDVLRHGEVFEREISDVVERAAEYLVSGSDEATKTELTRLLERLVWSEQALEAMAGIGAGANAPLFVAAGPVAAAQFSQDCSTFFHEYQDAVEGVSQCLEAESKIIGGQDYRVFKPAPGLPDAGWTSDHRAWVFAAIEDTFNVFSTAGIGQLPPANVVLSTVTSSVEQDAGIDPPVGIAAAAPSGNQPCGVVLYGGMQSYDQADFKQIVVHEMAHCFQRVLYPDQATARPRSWWAEGQAEFLANFVYPTNNLEHDRLPHSNLEAHELSTTLFDRRYSNFIFFQYLANRRGIKPMLAVISALPPDGGQSAQEESLAGSVGAQLFQEYAQAVTDVQVTDSGGGAIPYRMTKTNQPEEQLTAEAVPLHDLELRPFAVFRRKLIVPSGQQACLMDSAEQAVGRARPEPPTPWDEVPPVVPLAEEAPRTLVVVASAVEQGTYQLDVMSVHSTREGAGDSVVGKWVLYNASVHERIEYIAPINDVSSIGGRVAAIFRDDGTVDVEFEGFSVEGSSEVQLEDGVFSSDHSVQYSSVTEASGTTGYEVAGDYIFYDALFAETYLEGEEYVQQAREGTFLKIETEERLLEIDAVPLEYQSETSGWGMFTAGEEFELLCGGNVLRLNSAILEYQGPPDE